MKVRKVHTVKIIVCCVLAMLLVNLIFQNYFSYIPRIDDSRPFLSSVVDLQTSSLMNKELQQFYRRLRHSQITNALFDVQGNFTFPSVLDYFRRIDSNIGQKSAFPIFPSESILERDDRIWNQMRYAPEHLQKAGTRSKHILLYHGLNGVTNSVFTQCPVNKCIVSGDGQDAETADVILWMHSLSIPTHRRPPGQIWALYLLESPFHTPRFEDLEKFGDKYTINWTATYRLESTIVTPYYKYTPFDLTDDSTKPKQSLPQKNYAHGKSKLVAWFVSNCASYNKRLELVEDLQKLIKIDIYGLCGTLQCPREQQKACFQLLSKEYKFYLAFENSNCRDYITEKFFFNGLSNDVVPIVMGAHPDDYRRVAPFHSYIHIEDFHSLEGLVSYLKYLDKNDTAYNEYFSWKGTGLVDTNSFFWCRLCMMAHEGDVVKTAVSRVSSWWFNKNACTNSTRWKSNNVLFK